MDNICFFVRIRQSICQSGVPINNERTFSNIPANTEILLDNGYILTISRSSCDTIQLFFNNPALNISFAAIVNNESTSIFDLPIEGGTYRIAIFVAMRCCENCPCGNS